MRHANRINHLGRTDAHRKALMSNMAASLIMHKRISTTLAKAKELRKFVEPLVTRSKNDTTNSRRLVFSYLQNKQVVTELFREISIKVATCLGGYICILKTSFRKGDNAEMCIMEFVDYNETYTTGATTKKVTKTRRGGKKSTKTTVEEPVAEVKAETASTPETETPAAE